MDSPLMVFCSERLSRFILKRELVYNGLEKNLEVQFYTVFLYLCPTLVLYSDGKALCVLYNVGYPSWRIFICGEKSLLAQRCNTCKIHINRINICYALHFCCFLLLCSRQYEGNYFCSLAFNFYANLL